jgi:hypothetical protein
MTPSAFPVPLTFSAVDPELDVSIRITAEVAGVPPDFESLEEAIDILATAAGWGMFPAPSMAPSARPEVRSLPAKVEGSKFDKTIQARGLHPGAYRVLLNILAQLHYDVVELRSLELRATGAGRVLALAEVLDAGFPAPPASLPFALQVPEDLEVREQLVFRIQLAGPEAPRVFPELAERLADWDSVVTLGGYMESFEEVDLQIFPLGSAERFADTIEHRVSSFALSAAAVNGLLNLLSRIHAAVTPIRQLEIE